MIQASRHVPCIISMHGWSNQHRTTHCNSPLPPPQSNHYLQAHVPCHPKRPNVTPSLGDHDFYDGSIAPPCAHLQHSTKESEKIQEASQSKSRKRQDSKQTQALAFTFCFLPPSRLVVVSNASPTLLASL